MTGEVASIFAETRSWVEMLYFISQIIVMFLIAFGLRQLYLAKMQIETTKEIFRTQSRRAAVEAAVLECRRYADTIIQDKLVLDKFCEDNSITYFDRVKLTRTDSGFSVDPSDIDITDIKKLADAKDILNRIYNGLESYSLFFLSGVADENIAFHSNAKAFIDMSEHMFKLFPILKIEEDDAEPIKALYILWRKKNEAKELKIKQSEINKKLSTYKATDIQAIGT